MAEQPNSLMKKGEETANDFITFALEIMRALVLSVVWPPWAIATIRSATGPAGNGVGASLYLAVCAFVAMSLPNFVLRRSEGAYENLQLRDIFAPMSFDVVLMKVLPILLACYALSKYFSKTRPRPRAEFGPMPVTDDLPRYLFGAGYAVLIGTVAISAVMLVTTPPTEQFGYYALALSAGLFLVVWVLHAGLQADNEFFENKLSALAEAGRIAKFVGLLWLASTIFVMFDQLSSPSVEMPKSGVAVGKVWLDSTGERMRLIVFFVNHSKRSVYWRPGAVSVLLAGKEILDTSGWTISPDSSARSLTSPEASNFVAIEFPQPAPDSILQDWKEVSIRSDQLNNARQDDPYFLSLPSEEWTAQTYEWKVKLGFAQTPDERAAIARRKKAVVP